MKGKKNVEELLNRYLKGTATDQEITLIEEWYKSLDQINDKPLLNSEDQIFLHVSTRMEIEKRLTKNRRSVLHLWPLMAAASVIFLAVAFAFLYSSNESVDTVAESSTVSYASPLILENKAGSDQFFVLPDSSTVRLTANSRLRIDDDFNKNIRKVTLHGEAFFEVRHHPEKPFYVHAGEVVTKVLGTSFVVRAYDDTDSITVSVRTGKVSVFSSESPQNSDTENELVILPNQQIVFSRAKGEASKMLVENPVALIPEKASEKVKYVSAPISEVIEALEVLYGVEIEYDTAAFSSCRLTTTLSGDGIYSRLNSISKAIGSTYFQENGKIFLQGEGCKE